MWVKVVFVLMFANRVTADVLEEDKLQISLESNEREPGFKANYRYTKSNLTTCEGIC